MSLQTIDWASTLLQDLDDLSEVFSTSASTTPALLPGERRTVAILFLDLEGFTALSEQLDHETLHKITSNVMSRLSRIVEFHGGYVDKFEGDRIMALFGAEKAHDNDCVRAVSCAMRMIGVVQEFSAMLRSRGFSVDARSGVSYGDVTVAPDPSGHITATGDRVNIASRMEETAETGTVQATKEVRDTAGDQFQWDDLGLVSIKGKKEKVHAFRPTGPGRTQIERWERAKKLSSVPFVGRGTELSELKQLLSRQSTSEAEYNRRGGAMHIFAGIKGVAGIGKSRLIHEFRKNLESSTEGALVLKAGCASYAQPPLWLILSLIRNWLDPGSDHLPAENDVRNGLKALLSKRDVEGDAIREESIDNLALLLSSGSKGLPSSSSDVSENKARLQVLSSLSDLVRVLSDSSKRLVVILDDVHWVDSASRECIEFFATSCDTKLPILFMLMYRPEPAAGCEIIENLPAEYTFTSEIALEEIDPDSSRELIRHLLKIDSAHAPAEDIVEFLLKSSGGNAFFIEELVLGLTETGLLQQDASGSWMLMASPDSMVIPQSIKGLIRARTDQLPAEPRRILQVASVLGEEFNSEVLFQVALDTGLENNPEEPFRELLERGFLHPDTENQVIVRFDHVLARDAVYETILKQNRRYLHALCADVLSQREENDPNLAGSITRHLGDAGDIEKAIPWGVKAQKLAADRYDSDAVLFWAEKLEKWIRERLDSEDDARLLAGVLMRRQVVEGYRLHRKQQTETLDKFNDLITQWNLQDLKAQHKFSLGNMYRRSVDMPKALEMFTGALELFEQSGNKKGIARASSAIAMCNKHMGLLKQSEENFNYAISLFRELGDIENIARSLFGLASTMLLLGRYNDGLEILEEAFDLSRKSGTRTVEANVLGLRGILLLQIGWYEEALRSQELALAIYREVGDKSDELSSLNSICNAYYRMGRHDEAREFGLETLHASREFGGRRTEANVLCTLGLVELSSSRNQEALDYFHKSLKAQQDIGGKFAQAAVHWNLSLTLYNLLRFEEGLEYARKSIELYKEVGNRTRAASKLAFHPVTLIETGRIDEAVACLEEYEKDFSDVEDFNVHIQVRYARGYLALSRGELQKAEEYFKDAFEIAHANNINECVGQSLQNIGLIKLQQGKTREAEEYLRKGCEALDGTEYFRTFLPDAEYFFMTGNKEEAIQFARQAYARAEATGNERTMNRAMEILIELGEES